MFFFTATTPDILVYYGTLNYLYTPAAGLYASVIEVFPMYTGISVTFEL